jgi:hypothetical protein
MSGTTSIDDLPTDPLGGQNNGNNMSLNASENVVINSQQSHAPSNTNNLNLDQNTIQQIVSSLQQASISGATLLPSRDIPMTTTNLSNDIQTQPNYIPPIQESQRDYISRSEQSEDIIKYYNNNLKAQNNVDDIYSEIQIPLLLAVLYFLFQLPFFRKFLYSYFPILFSKDGNLNINGFIFTSVLFGVLFYVLNKVTDHFSAF